MAISVSNNAFLSRRFVDAVFRCSPSCWSTGPRAGRPPVLYAHLFHSVHDLRTRLVWLRIPNRPPQPVKAATHSPSLQPEGSQLSWLRPVQGSQRMPRHCYAAFAARHITPSAIRTRILVAQGAAIDHYTTSNLQQLLISCSPIFLAGLDIPCWKSVRPHLRMSSASPVNAIPFSCHTNVMQPAPYM